MMVFRILGPVEVSLGERMLPAGGPKQVTLLAFLVLHANRAVSSDALVDAVWGPTRSGAGNRLQMAITRLRKVLEPLSGSEGPVLRTVSGGYLLSVGPGELDAEVFAELVREGREALFAGESARAAELLHEALALWRGPPLADVCFEDFAQAEIRRLEELRLVAFEARVDADLALGRHAPLIVELQGLLAEQPTREGVASQLMLALYRSGRQADALEIYQRIRVHLAHELGLEPGPALKALQSQILGQAPSLLASNRPTYGERQQPTGDAQASIREHRAPARTIAAFPVPPTRMIGREQELDAVARLLGSPDSRLVTLTGPGGVGKTRLAVAVAHAIGSSFVDGACWVELASVARSDEVGSTVARALGVTPLPGESMGDALCRYLASKRLLLVLDNFEHVLDATAVIGELHASCPELTMLITSRETLHLAAEHRVVLSPLALPPVAEQTTVAEIESAAASALFLAAARRRDSRFAIWPASAPVIAQICARVDGLPLALELAAGRTTLLGLDELLARLDAAVSDPDAGPRNAPARQRTLDATIEWSVRLLDEDQVSAFVRFAVFAGAANVETVREVTGVALGTLEALAAKSLLDRRQLPDGSTRLVMLETVRQYAQKRLAEDPEQDTIRRRHLEHYLHMVEESVACLHTHQERDALVVIDREIDDIRAALRWALEGSPPGALRLAGHLGEYWWIRHDLDGLRWLDAALEAAGERAPRQDRARALLQRATFISSSSSSGQAVIDLAEEALALYREADDHAGIADALCSVAIGVGVFHGDREEERRYAEAACRHARMTSDDRVLGKALSTLAAVSDDDRGAIVEQAAEVLTSVGNHQGLARLYSNAAYVALLEDRVPEAIRLLELALPAAEQADSPWWAMCTLGNIGLANLLAGDVLPARVAFERSLQLSVEHALGGNAEALLGIAAVAVGQARYEAAWRLRGAAKSAGYPSNPTEEEVANRLERDYFRPARARYGLASSRRAEKAGATMSPNEAVAFALDQPRQVANSQASSQSRQARGVESTAEANST